jgi:hypothetical protein
MTITAVANCGLLFLSLLSVGCGPAPTDNFKHVFRAVDSPSGTVTAHVARNASGGAAGSLTYDIYLTEKESEEAPERVFNGYGDCNPEIEWRSDQLLMIRYAAEHCEIYGFRNFYWHHNESGLTVAQRPRLEIALLRIEPVSEHRVPSAIR